MNPEHGPVVGQPFSYLNERIMWMVQAGTFAEKPMLVQEVRTGKQWHDQALFISARFETTAHDPKVDG